jgi:hypothetical protein
VSKTKAIFLDGEESRGRPLLHHVHLQANTLQMAAFGAGILFSEKHLDFVKRLHAPGTQRQERVTRCLYRSTVISFSQIAQVCCFLSKGNSMDTSDRIRITEQILERTLGLISHSDSKGGILFPICTGMLGVLALVIPEPDKWPTTGAVTAAVAMVGLLLSVLFISLAVFPRTHFPDKSLIFFGSIKDLSLSQYSEQIKSLDEEAYLEDLVEECHTNSVIASNKSKWLKFSVVSVYLSTPFWLMSVYLLYSQR